MLVNVALKSTRYIGLLGLACALALPAQMARSEDGGGEAVDFTPTVRPAKPQQQAKPAQTAPKPTTTRRTTTQRPATTAPKPTRRTQPRAPRIVETAPSGLPPAEETRFITNEVIVRFQLSSTAGARNRAIRRSPERGRLRVFLSGERLSWIRSAIRAPGTAKT